MLNQNVKTDLNFVFNITGKYVYKSLYIFNKFTWKKIMTVFLSVSLKFYVDFFFQNYVTANKIQRHYVF